MKASRSISRDVFLFHGRNRALFSPLKNDMEWLNSGETPSENVDKRGFFYLVLIFLNFLEKTGDKFIQCVI
ncbi:hypothetical protein AS888_06330 [Peribacillus simplex]|uniref:Uncharacterized protein n=1 Tax=Peribacillus simplex TaxID=1478 RepID=A0A120GPR4_9BACI|nr:hypothetical protein AS888_06330 [Peribacillus simplex]